MSTVVHNHFNVIMKMATFNYSNINTIPNCCKYLCVYLPSKKGHVCEYCATMLSMSRKCLGARSVCDACDAHISEI